MKYIKEEASRLYPYVQFIGDLFYIEEGAVIRADADIGEHVVIRADTVIGEGAIIRADAVIRAGAVIGADAIIRAGAVIGERADIGAGAVIGEGAVIGADAVVPSMNGLYKYNSNCYWDIKTGLPYIRLGCYIRTIEEWDNDFNNNQTEFPVGSPQWKDRMWVKEAHKSWLLAHPITNGE
jgi:hypothetical protein